MVRFWTLNMRINFILTLKVILRVKFNFKGWSTGNRHHIRYVSTHTKIVSRDS